MESFILRCQLCGTRAIEDALELERKEGARVVLGCMPCLRRTALRPYWRVHRLPQILMQMVRGLALPWITPTVWLRDALLEIGWTTEEFRARQSGRLVASVAGDARLRLRVARDTLLLLRHLAAADGETSAQEWQALRRAVYAQHVGDEEIWQQVDPGRTPLPPPTEREWRDACRRLRPVLRGFDPQLILHCFDVVVHASDGLLHGERAAVFEVVANLGLDAQLFASRFGESEQTSAEVAFSAYEILGVERNASPRELRRAYLKLAMENHPDRVARLGPDMVAAANARMKEINRAYEELKR